MRQSRDPSTNRRTVLLWKFLRWADFIIDTSDAPPSYFHYYSKLRTHLALAKDVPEPRAVDKPENGFIVEIPEVGGLHHRLRATRRLAVLLGNVLPSMFGSVCP